MKNTIFQIFLLSLIANCANYSTEPNLLGLLLLPATVNKITIAPGGVNPVTEGGVSEALNIRLPEEPTNPVTVTIIPVSQVTVNSTTLVFTPTDWNSNKSVLVSAIDDFDIENGHTGTIQFTVDSGDPRYYRTSVNDVTVDIVDNESAGVSIVQSGGSTDVIEGGATDTYTVVLTTNITSNVTITVDPDIQTDLGNGNGALITLTFTSSNWSTPQTVTVTARNDAGAEGDHTSNITHTIATGPVDYLALGPTPASFQTVTANITDNDTASMNVNGTIIVDETGSTSDTFTVNLGYRPDAAVVVTITPQDARLNVGSGYGNAHVLNFTGNVACGGVPTWCANQTVTVTADDDAVSDGSTYTKNITISSAGAAPYAALAPQVITATIVDNESIGVYIAESGGSTAATEGGATDSYTIKLTSDPGANVTITSTPDAELDLGSGAAAPVARTFTSGGCPGPGNWCVAQSITVTANNDIIAEGTHNGIITHAITTQSLPDYPLAFVIPGITTTITDNEKRIFVTAASWQGQNVGNIASADAKCMADAVAIAAGGTWRALIAEPNAPGRRASLTANAGDGQISWVLRNSFDYYRADGTTPLFTTNANGLFVFGNYTNSMGGGLAWTGLNSDWTSKSVAGTCTGWASAAGTGGTGDTSQTNNTSINSTDPLCNGPAHSLICVEQ